jgi:hypothetical protein
MRFGAFKEFQKELSTTLDTVTAYLDREMTATLRELRTGLYRLTFQDNFESFQVSLTIAASSEVIIKNELKGIIPSGYIVLRCNEFGRYVHDGGSKWTTDYLYLTNPQATEATLTVRFFK